MTGIERLRRMVDDDVIAVPCVCGTYKSGYVAAIHDVRREALSIADQIEREHAQTVEDHEKQQEIIRDLQHERDEALRAAAASRKVASELRTLAGAWDEWGLGGKLMSLAERLEAHGAAEAHVTEVASKTYASDELYERKASCDDHHSERDATFEGEKVTRDVSIAVPVLAVVEEMERHCLGVEGMEDSPVARWARELREVVGWPVRGEEDARAAKWVREHGGLEEVARATRDADNRRVELCSWLGVDTTTGWSDAVAELDRRIMPLGMEWLLEVWPKWSNGEYCRFGDWWTADRYGDHEPRQLRRLVIYTPELLDEWEQGDGESYGYEWDFTRPSEVDYRPYKVEPSDSWEKLEDDYTISERRYYATRIGHDVGLMDDAEIHEAVSRDLVRRAKALAERERGE